MKRSVFFLLMSFFSMGIVPAAQALAPLKERPKMEAAVKILKEQNVEHYIFTNPQGSRFLVVPKFGARILAVNVGGDNLFWTHPDISKGQGGQRTWISPEGGAKGFIFKPDWSGPRDISMMDPGNYRVSHYEENRLLKLCNSFKTSSNDQKEAYDLTIEREFRLEEDPLRDELEFEGAEYSYLGIDFVHKLRNNGSHLLDRILALWCLIQVPPKGTMIVPIDKVTREAWRGNYFEPVPEEYVRENRDSFSFFLHGSRRYKVGVRPESAQGLIGYVFKMEEGDYGLVFMRFPVKPEGRYVDRPKEEQETNGDAVQIYSHLEEGLMAFGELECHSWGMGLEPGGEKAFPIKIFLYKSSLDTLKKIGAKLLCKEFEKAYFF